MAQATDNLEQFRLDAASAIQAFSPQDRKDVAAIETPELAAHAFFAEWSQRTRPALTQLELQLGDTVFRDNLAQRLQLNDLNTSKKWKEVVAERRDELRQELVTLLYPAPYDGKKDHTKRQREHAKTLLVRTSDNIESLRKRQESYDLYRTVAATYNVPVIDPYDSWLRRKKIIRQISKDRQHIIVSEAARLRTITAQLSSLLNTCEGLLGKVTEKNWDLITIISMRNSYEKRLGTLSAADAQKSLKRLSLFEKVTKTFRDEQIELLTSGENGSTNLADTRKVAQEVDDLLLQIFDLSNTEKNRLLTAAKEVRELTRERDHIFSVRTKREAFLQKPGQ